MSADLPEALAALGLRTTPRTREDLARGGAAGPQLGAAHESSDSVAADRTAGLLNGAHGEPGGGGPQKPRCCMNTLRMSAVITALSAARFHAPPTAAARRGSRCGPPQTRFSHEHRIIGIH